jgi:hypothetical protein
LAVFYFSSNEFYMQSKITRRYEIGVAGATPAVERAAGRVIDASDVVATMIEPSAAI